ncbi:MULTISPECIES: HNH endonuclease [Mycobacterium]|uniref:HNH endonuclease n=1 Tax=Mycobacterium TaxID=1763 RepID=UPI0002AC39F9|nr:MULTISPECIES: HNH endonuclease [Mycobacterium]ELR85685.1 HNH endonuclease [Mycobacterium sp. H4Y]
MISVVGEDHANAKLTATAVVAIRKKYATGRFTHRELARQYGVQHSLIGGIVRRTRWRHIQ